jgi:uncharacterized membrane protein YgaE (UPF0421/DUF939 family)
MSHHENDIQEEVMEEMGLEISAHTKLLQKIIVITLVVALGAGLALTINWFMSKPIQPSKTERFLNSVEQIQQDINKMRKDEDAEHK